jgi:hypothetical protein
MDRTTSRRIYNEFTTEVDINRPDGILRSSDVDKYVEKALKPLIEEGKAFRRVSVNRRTGIRSTRYSYQGGKNIQDSINAILAEMPASLGYDLDPVTGNVSGTNKPPPMSVTNQGRHYYNETRERILDPRTAAAIRADALRAGGVSTVADARGYTTVILRAGLSGETRKMRRLVDETDAKYLAGELPSSALADGASPATILERARAQITRQANLKDARQAAIEDYIQAHPDSQLAIERAIKTQKVTNREEKARVLAAERTPGTPEFQTKIFRDLRAQDAREDTVEKFIEQNQNSRLAVRKRQRTWARRRQKAKQLGGRTIHTARAAVITAVGTILALITTGVALLAKSYQVITQIGSDIRKRAISEAKFNFAPDTVRGFEIFAAERGGMDRDLLVRAAGGIQTSWSTPLNYADSGFNQLAPYLRENTVHLVKMATAEGDANVLDIMSTVIDDLILQSLRGVSGAKTFDPSSAEGRHRAFSGNLTALSSHNEAWGELMNLYWQDFLSSGASNIGTWKVADRNGQMRSMSFENWVTQVDWAKQYQKNTGLSSPVIRDVAQETYGLVSNFVGTFSNLGTDIITGLSGYFGQVVENLRNIINNWLSPYFPAFAMKENQRAEYLNTQSQMLANRLLPGYETDAKRALLDIRYDYDLAKFREVIEAIGRGDINSIPYQVDLTALRDNMSVFTRYYHVQDIIKNIETERTKAAGDNNYVQKYIVGTSSSIATVSGERALVLQNRLDRGAQNIRIRPPEQDTQITKQDFRKQVAIGVVNAPNAVGRAVDQVVKTAASMVNPRTVRLERSIEQTGQNIARYKGKKGVFGIKPLYDTMERDLRELVQAYDRAGEYYRALGALQRLQLFYRNYPSELVKQNPAQRRSINKKIAQDSSWLWMGDNFAKAAQVLHPAELDAQIEERIRQVESQRKYANTQTDLASRGRVQQRTTNEITAAGLEAKVAERLDAEADLSHNPDLESMYRWLRANRANAIYLDAFDERNNRAMSDIIINFNTDGVVKKTIRIPNTYGLKKDVNLTRSAGITMDITAALEAESATE